MRHEVRILNGPSMTAPLTYVDASYAGGVRGRESALTDAAFYVAKHQPAKDAKVSVVEMSSRLGTLTLISWTAMYDERSSDGPLVWVLETAAGMHHGECDSLGIDWQAERDRRIALGGEW